MSIIGQKDLLENLKSLLESGVVPRCIILRGGRRSGKTYLAKEISKLIAKYSVVVGKSVDDIRTMIDLAYKVADTTCYTIDDLDKVSIGAKNCLLKVTEEPPRKAHLLLTCSNLSHVPETLISRSAVLHLKDYSEKSLAEYIKSTDLNFKPEEVELLVKFCSSPKEINYFLDKDIKKFAELIVRISNINELTGVESFKLSSQIKLKAEGEGFDLLMVMDKFCQYMLGQLRDERVEPNIGFDMLYVTKKHMKTIENGSLNLTSVFDMWILDLRGL